MTASERAEIIEQCARAAEQQDRCGREWVLDSLWANILRRAGQNVRALKSRPNAPSIDPEAPSWAIDESVVSAGCAVAETPKD